MPTETALHTRMREILGDAQYQVMSAKAAILDILIERVHGALVDETRRHDVPTGPAPTPDPISEPVQTVTSSPAPAPAAAPAAEPDDLLASTPRATRGRPRKPRGTDAPQTEPAPVVEAAPEGEDLFAEPTPAAAEVAPEDEGEDFFGGLQ